MHNEVKKQIRPTYHAIADSYVAALNDLIRTWNEKPQFKIKVTVGKTWRITIRYDKRTKMGKIFNWVDQGSGSYRPGSGFGKWYDIVAKNKKYLYYELPANIKTVAASGRIAPSATAKPGVVIRKAVKHPGIDPRYFSEKAREPFRGRGSGSFHGETEAAIKRGLRRIGT